MMPTWSTAIVWNRKGFLCVAYNTAWGGGGVPRSGQGLSRFVDE